MTCPINRSKYATILTEEIPGSNSQMRFISDKHVFYKCMRTIQWKDTNDNDHLIETYDMGKGRFFSKKYLNSQEEHWVPTPAVPYSFKEYITRLIGSFQRN